MAGINRHTGQPITGWPEVEQSLQVILTTQIGDRVNRRGFGSREGELLDRPMTFSTVVDHFAAIAEAIEPRLVNGRQYGEPRFDLARIVPAGDESGQVRFDLIGLHYPRGHLGDFTAYETVRGSVALTDASTGEAAA